MIGPLTTITLVAMMVSLMITVVNKFAVDQNVIREIKKQIKKYQKEMKANRNNIDKMKEIQPKMMELSMKQMKMSFKPMLYYFLPLILVFSWLKKTMVGVVVLPLAFWPGHLGWLGSYILLSILFSTVFRKLLKVQ